MSNMSGGSFAPRRSTFRVAHPGARACPEFVAKAAEDNLSTHKPKRDMWLARHKNVTLLLHADPRPP